MAWFARHVYAEVGKQSARLAIVRAGVLRLLEGAVAEIQQKRDRVVLLLLLLVLVVALLLREDVLAVLLLVVLVDVLDVLGVLAVLVLGGLGHGRGGVVVVRLFGT